MKKLIFCSSLPSLLWWPERMMPASMTSADMNDKMKKLLPPVEELEKLL